MKGEKQMIYKNIAFKADPFSYDLGFDDRITLVGGDSGTGKTIPPMVILLISLCLFRILWVQFILPCFGSIEGVFILYPVSWAFGMVLMILYTWKGHWLKG